MTTIENNFLESSKKLFRYYKGLGEKAIAQLTDDEINWRPNESSNSVSLIVHHLSGNMLSRFTDFLTTDGEKSWRNREAEFSESYQTRNEMMDAWKKGWDTLFATLDSLTESDLNRTVFVRNEGHTVLEAIQRQLAHYPHHVGQILYIAKLLKGDSWKSLSIPKGESVQFNKEKFSQKKGQRHFTDKA